MTTASSIRSAWEKLSAITCSALHRVGVGGDAAVGGERRPEQGPDGHDRGGQDQPPRGHDPPRVDGGDACQALGDRRTARVRELAVTDLRTCRGHGVVPLVGPVRLVGSWLAGSGVLSCDPGGEDVVGMVGEVVADQGVEQVGVVVQVSGGKGDELPIPGRGGARCGPGEEPSRLAGSSATSAAATSSAGGVVRLCARSRISPAAVASPPISRRSRTSMSMGMRSQCWSALTIP